MFIKNSIFVTILFLFMLQVVSLAQPRWKSGEQAAQDLHLFHSTHVLNLPTAETLQQGDFEFEISHRFVTPVSAGVSELYGFDGRVNMRIGLAYAASNRSLFTLARSNREGNIDLKWKLGVLQIPGDVLPSLIAVQAGMAFNGKPESDVESASRKYQYFVSVIFNTMYEKKYALGIVPSYTYNSHIYCKDVQDSYTVGIYLQHYVTENWSFNIELNPTIRGWRAFHNAFSTGFEVETGGHFFKFLVGNSTSLNHAQFAAGADNSFSSGDWHFGFNITRLLKFW